MLARATGFNREIGPSAGQRDAIKDFDYWYDRYINYATDAWASNEYVPSHLRSQWISYSADCRLEDRYRKLHIVFECCRTDHK